jgi:hypothetical protein
MHRSLTMLIGVCATNMGHRGSTTCYSKDVSITESSGVWLSKDEVEEINA